MPYAVDIAYWYKQLQQRCEKVDQAAIVLVAVLTNAMLNGPQNRIDTTFIPITYSLSFSHLLMSALDVSLRCRLRLYVIQFIFPVLFRSR